MQSACTVLYCHLWPVRLYHIFPHDLKKGTIFGTSLLNVKYVSSFSLLILSEILPIQPLFSDTLLYMYMSLHVKYKVVQI
jgi:hypothetical protein